MDEKEKKSKAFVIIMSIVVILLIVIGTLLSWEIIQDGRKNNALSIQTETIIMKQVIHTEIDRIL